MQCHLARLVVEVQFGISANAAGLPFSPALVSSDPHERIEVDFLLLFFTYIRPDFRYLLGPMDVPHHRMRARTPAINPTNNAALIGPEQIGDRDALTFIIVH